MFKCSGVTPLDANESLWVCVVNGLFPYFCGQIRRKLTSKKIYLIRHGQTEFNLRGIVQGSGIDSSLNETGISQSEAFYSVYKDVAFDKIYTSVLKRSQQSVGAFIQNGIAHQALAGLNEINWGNKEGMNITPDEDAYYHWLLQQWQQNNTSLRIEGGESPDEVALRQKPVLDLILNNPDEKTVLICMHGRAIRILLCQLLNYPLCAMDLFEHRNLCLYQLHYTGSMCKVELFNNVEHLYEMRVPSL